MCISGHVYPWTVPLAKDHSEGSCIQCDIFENVEVTELSKGQPSPEEDIK